MYKYKVFFNEEENETEEILKLVKVNLPSWDCLSLTNPSDELAESKTNEIIITNGLSYDSLDKAGEIANIEVITAFLRLFGMTNFTVYTDVSFNNFFG